MIAKGTGLLLRYLFPIILLISGIVLLIVGVGDMSKRNTYLETSAVISRIDAEYDPAREEMDYEVYVDYTVDGRTYTSPLGEYVANYREGMELTVLYNPDNPGEIISAGPLGPIVAFGMGGVAFLIGIVMSLRTFGPMVFYALRRKEKWE